MQNRPLYVRGVLFLAVIATCLITAACGGSAEPAGTVVLVTVDSFRPDRLSLYGGPVGMPALDRLADRGTVFEDMTTVVPQSRPAAATLLTGMLPAEHGVRNDISDRLGPTVSTLPALFGHAGYSTAAFVSSGLNSWTSGFQNSFDLFDGPETFTLGPGGYAPPVRPSGEALDHFEAWMNAPGASGSRFVWIHLADLQDVATDAEAGKAGDAYDEALVGLDGQLARLVDFLELWSRETGPVELMLVGTYGVHLEDDEFKVARGSSYWLDRETLQVPAISARFGGEPPAAGRDSGPGWLPDVYATLHAFASEEVAPGEHGVDLRSETSAGERTERVRYAWSWAPDEELLWPVLTAVNIGSVWTAFDSETLDRQAPGESGDNRAFALAQQHAGRGRDYRLSDETRRTIRESGIKIGDRNQPSPLLTGAERAAFLTELFQLRNHFAQGRDRRVARTSNRVLTAHPDNLAALYCRASFMVMAGGIEPAEELFAVMLERYPDTPEVLHWAAHLELAREQPDRAFALLQAARSLGWSDGDLLYDLACVHARKGEKQQALDSLGEAIQAGYRNWDWIDQDPDLAALRADPGYSRLMSARGR